MQCRLMANQRSSAAATEIELTVGDISKIIISYMRALRKHSFESEELYKNLLQQSMTKLQIMLLAIIKFFISKYHSRFYYTHLHTKVCS